MAKYAGGVGVTGFMCPADTADTYAIQDEFFNRGGYRTVADLTERDAITPDRRKLGMLVYCIAEDTYYTIKTGLDNTDWEESNFGGGVSTFIQLSDTPADYSGGGYRSLGAVTADRTTGEIIYSDNYGSEIEYLNGDGSNIQNRMSGDKSHVYLNSNFTAVNDVAYLPYINYLNYKLQGMLLVVFGNANVPIKLRPVPDSVGGGGNNDSLLGLDNTVVPEIIIPSGATCLFTSYNDDPQQWKFLGFLGTGETSEEWYDIVADTNVTSAGKYFISGDNTVLTIDNDTTLNREFEIKNVEGTSIIKTEDGIIEGENQDIILSGKSSMKLLIKKDNSAWITSMY